MRKERLPFATSVLTLAFLATLTTSVIAQDLPVWASIPSDDGVVEVFSDGPPLLNVVFHEDPASLLEDTIHYDVHVAGEALDETAAQAVMHDLLDAIQFLHLWNHNALGHEAAYLTPYTRVRGEGQDTWTAHYPFTVAREDGADTNQSRALLDEAPGKAPGLDNQRVRRILWRDVLLDTAMLGTLRETLAGRDIPGFMTGGDPRLASSTQAATAFEQLREGTDTLANVNQVPNRLSDLVTLARQAGIPAQTVQRAIDASLLPQGLTSDVPYQSLGAVRQGSPFDELLTHTEQLGLGLDILSLASQVTSDAFDGIAMQLAANEAANARLRFLEQLVAEDCAVMSDRVDPALCNGLTLAREEFDALSDGLYTGIAKGITQAMTDTDSLLTYSGVTASITGHIATLAGAGVLSTSATVAGAGVLVFKSLSSIAGEYQLVRRAFLLAHLNDLLQERAEQLGGPHPSDMTHANAWQTSRQHTTLALTIQWMYFHTLHQGYTASRYSPAGLFHNLTQWIHGSASTVDDLANYQATARNQITTFQPLSTTVTIQTTSTSPSDQQKRDSTPTEAWTHQFGTSSHDRARSVAIDASGNALVAGNSFGSLAGENAGDSDAFVRKLDPDGNQIWIHQFGTSSFDEASSVAIDASGNALVAGSSEGSLAGENAGDMDAFVRKLKPGPTVSQEDPDLAAPPELGEAACPPATATFDAGGLYSLALDQHGNAWAWGANFDGELGDGTTTNRDTPVRIDMPTDVAFTSVYAGFAYSIAIDQNCNTWGWGQNYAGQLGDGTATDRHTPVQVDMPNGVTFTNVYVGGDHVLALDQQGNLWAWGRNARGQLGDGTTTDRSTPVLVAMPDSTTFTTVHAGPFHSLALDQNGEIWAWGANNAARLGDGTQIDKHTPIKIDTPDDTSFIAVTGGGSGVPGYSLALDQHGNLWAWGLNWYGQLGDGSTTSRRTPVPVTMPSGVTFTAIRAFGGDHSLALDQHGNAWEWGANFDGELGDGTTTNRDTPVPVKMPSGVTFTNLQVNMGHTLALDQKGNLWAWGQNDFGELGDGTTTDRPTPVQIELR